MAESIIFDKFIDSTGVTVDSAGTTLEEWMSDLFFYKKIEWTQTINGITGITVDFNTPSGYTVTSITMLHNNTLNVTGGFEAITNSGASGFMNASSSLSTNFTVLVFGVKTANIKS